MPVKYTPGTSNQNTSIGTDPLTANTYTYVNGDPINFDDPTGHHLVCDDCSSAEQEELSAMEGQQAEKATAAYYAQQQVNLLQSVRMSSFVMYGQSSDGNQKLERVLENEGTYEAVQWYNACLAPGLTHLVACSQTGQDDYMQWADIIQTYLNAGGSVGDYLANGVSGGDQ